MTRLFGPITTELASGGAGTAGSITQSSFSIDGAVVGVYVENHTAVPDIGNLLSLKTQSDYGVYEILSISNSQDGWYYPVFQAVSPSGSPVSIYEKACIRDFLSIEISGVDDGDYANVWIVLDDNG